MPKGGTGAEYRAECHPEREHYARGRCADCYRRWRYEGQRPGHRIYNLGAQGLIDARIFHPGAVPPSCPRCRSAYLRQHPADPEVSCILCGWETLVMPEGGLRERHFLTRPSRDPREGRD